MSNVAAVSILALTIGLSLARPSVRGVRVHPSTAAVAGAALTVGLGILPASLLAETLGVLLLPLVTIVSLMVITLVAEQAGLFVVLARTIATLARGDARRLFAYLFFCGTLTGAVFTNDAAVLIFTPLVYKMVADVHDESWGPASAVPFYFAILYVANVVGALVISNPINLIVSNLFGIGFLEYVAWMLLPALVSILVSFVGMRLYFASALPRSCRVPTTVFARGMDRGFLAWAAGLLGLTLLGFFSEPLVGVPTWLVAVVGALALMVLAASRGDHGGLLPIVRGVGWDVIVFVLGMFVIVMGLRHVGLTQQIGGFISQVAGLEVGRLSYVTAFVSAVCSAFLNNHPTAYLMAGVIQEWSLPALETRRLVFSALIGGDLGPKMLPIGSLAAMLWFRMLRDRGVQISYLTYVRIGVPVTLAAVLAATLVLHLEFALVAALAPR